MPVVVFAGCQPVPLLSYLKALGVLRLLAEQADGDAAGGWRDDRFFVETRLGPAEVEHFFLEEYRPTPIMGPWAGGSGFFPRDRRVAIEHLLASPEPRLDAVRQTIHVVQRLLAEEGVSEKPKDEVKFRLLRRLRAALPDEALLWLDAALVLGDDKPAAAPLLGSGGNDGRFDFGRNYLERLDELGFTRGLVSGSAGLLREALWGTTVSGLCANAVGQFDPGGAGGPNATTGMEADSLLNPWDWVLGMEGALLFAGAASRRYQWNVESVRASFPFTVQSVPAGDNVPSEVEQGKARGELWLPLWERAATLPGVRQLLSEGRLSLGRRQARDGVESARAVATLGAQRGVKEFVRIGLYERYGRNYLATVMGRFPVRQEAAVGLLEWGPVARWLERYRSLAGGTPRHAGALRRLEAAILELARYGGAPRVIGLLSALGACERALATMGKPGSFAEGRELLPLPTLQPEWLRYADDGSAEYRLARAVASVGAHTGTPLRVNLEPVEYANDGRIRWRTQNALGVVRHPRLVGLFAGILERRLLDGGLAALEASAWAGLADVVGFIAGSVDDARLLDLLWAFACVSPDHGPPRHEADRPAQPIPRSYAMLKLGLSLGVLAHDAQTEQVQAEEAAAPGQRSPGAMTARRTLALLRSRDVDGAVAHAARRLRTSGVPVLPGRDTAGAERKTSFVPQTDPRRLAAALLIPVGPHDILRLRRLVGQRTEEAGEAARGSVEESEPLATPAD